VALPANGQSFGYNPGGTAAPGSGTPGSYGGEPGHGQTSGSG
jgi:hypothetical protein